MGVFSSSFFNSAKKDDSSRAELSHIYEEIYKKNAQLVEMNKIPTLLRTIDDIVLNSVIDVHQMASKVANAVVHAMGFRGFGILSLDKESQSLKTIAFTQLEFEGNQNKTNLALLFQKLSIPLLKTQNIVVRSIGHRSELTTAQLTELLDVHTPEEIASIQKELEISTIMVSPLIVRGSTIGALCFLLHDDLETLSGFERDLMVQLIGVIGIALDNALLYQEIQVANDKLNVLDKMKDDFVSVASDELRTPMTVIRLYLWMALHSTLENMKSKEKSYLEHAYSSKVRLIKLVNEMLNSSRIEPGRISVQIQKVDFNELVDHVIAKVKPRADVLSLILQVINRQLPPVVTDRDKIKEVFINLIGNSLKYTPAFGSITISFEVADRYVIARVKDTGVGIDKVMQQSLFQKFGFVGTSYTVNKSDSQGSGLGLYICKSIIESHKSTISVFSEGKDKGTTFSFTLRIYTDELFTQMQNQNTNGEPGLGVVHSTL